MPSRARIVRASRSGSPRQRAPLAAHRLDRAAAPGLVRPPLRSHREISAPSANPRCPRQRHSRGSMASRRRSRRGRGAGHRRRSSGAGHRRRSRGAASSASRARGSRRCARWRAALRFRLQPRGALGVASGPWNAVDPSCAYSLPLASSAAAARHLASHCSSERCWRIPGRSRYTGRYRAYPPAKASRRVYHHDVHCKLDTGCPTRDRQPFQQPSRTGTVVGHPAHNASKVATVVRRTCRPHPFTPRARTRKSRDRRRVTRQRGEAIRASRVRVPPAPMRFSLVLRVLSASP